MDRIIPSLDDSTQESPCLRNRYHIVDTDHPLKRSHFLERSTGNIAHTNQNNDSDRASDSHIYTSSGAAAAINMSVVPDSAVDSTSREEDLIENLRAQVAAYWAREDAYREQEEYVKRADDANIELNQELKALQEKYDKLEQQKKKVEAKVETGEENYKFMEKSYLEEKGGWEKAEREVAKLQAEKDEAGRKLKREEDAHQGTKRLYNNITQDIDGRIQQVVRETKAKQEKETKEKGLVLVNAVEHETYKKEARKTDILNAELIAIKKQLAHYERNEMASRFPHDLASRDDFDDLAPSMPERKTTPPRTFAEETIVYVPTERGPTTDNATQTKEGLELEAVAVDASTQLGGPRANIGTQIGGPRSSTEAQTVKVEDPKASTANSESEPIFTTTIGGVQSTSPDVPQTDDSERLTTTIGGMQSTSPFVPPPFTTRDSAAQAGGEQLMTTNRAMQSTSPDVPQADDSRRLTTTIGGRQSTAPVGDQINIKQGDQVKIIEVTKDKVIHHHSILGCFWETTRNMIIISRKVAERMPTSFTNPLPVGINLSGVLRRGQQRLDADKRTNDNPPLLAILEDPDIVDMPPIWQTLLEFFSYLSFFFFLYQCYVARAWVTEMMANNGIYRSYFSDLYTYHNREVRGIIPTVFSEGVARFAEQFTLALVRHLGIELETYPMPG